MGEAKFLGFKETEIRQSEPQVMGEGKFLGFKKTHLRQLEAGVKC